MTYEELSALAMDSQDFLCYIADTETYELLYLNKKTRETFNIKHHEEYLGKPCYVILQNKKYPCSFCTNAKLEEGKVLSWNTQNKRTQKHYALFDTLLQLNGRKVRIETAFDMSEHQEQVIRLSQRLMEEETLLHCIHTLMENVEIDEAINKLLEIIGTHYRAERTYLFELDYKTALAHNTYEWCVDKSLHELEKLQNIPLEALEPFIEHFQVHKELYVKNLEHEFEEHTEIYTALHRKQVKSMLMVPLYTKNIVVGFLGVDNPQHADLDFTLLHSVALFVYDDLKKRRMRQQLEHLSYTDMMTGLYNRNKYIERVAELEQMKLQSFGVVYADVNGLKQANDLYGHNYGDRILKSVATKLSAALKKDVYRIGGDEFIAFCPNISQQEFETLVAHLRKTALPQGDCSFSIGSLWKDKDIDVLREITRSDEIMYAEKQNYYKTMLPGRVNRRSAAAESVLSEIREGLFCTYLQPKVDLQTGKIVGAEALVRKHDHNGHVISPARFIPIYEHDGTIRHVDFFVLESVCQILAKIMTLGIAPLKISLNFSRVTFMEYDLVNAITTICDTYSIPYNYIDVEITETADKMDSDFFEEKLKNIRDAGFCVSLDDFGTNYSNLIILSLSEFSTIKMDKSLIDNISQNIKNRTIVEYLIKMINALKESVCIAEGIETEEQKEFLQQCGCMYGQGYLFYKPVPIETFLQLYEQNMKEHSSIVNEIY